MGVPSLFSKYISWVAECFSHWPDGNNMLFFRGHADADWELIPYALRNCNNISERQLILDYKQTNVTDMNYQEKIENMLVTMQHYGIPTRLLDWSMNPLIALFFACQPAKVRESIHIEQLHINLFSEKPKDGKVFCLNPWKAYKAILNGTASRHPLLMDILKESRMMLAQGWDYEAIKKVISRKYGYNLPYKELQLPVPFVGRYMVNRIASQKGAFVIWGNYDNAVSSTRSCIPLDKYPEYNDSLLPPFEIPASAKEEILAFLRKLDINNFSIFPDLEGMSRDIQSSGGIYKINKI